MQEETINSDPEAGTYKRIPPGYPWKKVSTDKNNYMIHFVFKTVFFTILNKYKSFFMVHTDPRPIFSSTFQALFKDKSHFFKDLFSTQFNCLACDSRFSSAISARSQPYLRRQLSGHTTDTMLFVCPLSVHG